MQREYNYDNVYMVPKECKVRSRSECDISVEFGPRKFRNPIILANMKSVIDYDTCYYLASKNMFYIMHRFHLEYKSLVAFIQQSEHQYGFSSISIGIQDKDRDLLRRLHLDEINPTYITIDVAHAHSQIVIDTAKYVKKLFPDTFLIVGNVATKTAINFIQDHSPADAFKIFIAPGAACSTKVKTGFTRGTVTCLQGCASVSNLPIIADGGIRESGHIALAMGLGADMVMSGSFMSGFDQNSGDIVEIDGHKKYIYYGSASFNNKRTKKHIEGKEVILDYKGNMNDHIYDIECSLKSAISYSGCKQLKDMVYNTQLFYMD